MKITDLLKRCSIDLDGQVTSKEETIDHMVSLMVESGNISDEEIYKSCVKKREEEGTTGIGEGIAIPHAKTPVVKEAGLAAMVVKNGVDYDSLDGLPVNLIFLIAAPDTKDNIHLEVLGRLSMLLMDEVFRENLIHAESVEQFLAYVDEAEKEKFGEEDASEETNAKEEQEKEKHQSSEGRYQILAVTACPTGIAHTYMAAESFERTAKELGYTIKVETNGSGGDKNVLTPEEIASCDCIIVAADKDVRMARFDGKPVIVTKVANGIHRAKELIEEAESGTISVYHSDRKEEVEAFGGEKESFGRKIYKNLMNGVSHMLPFVIGGGILIALAFLFDDANAGTDIFGTGNTFSRFLKTVGDTAFGMMFPILAGYIAMSIADRPALMPGIVGGLLAKAGTSVFLPEDQWISSGFFGELIAGFVAGYLMLLLKKAFERLPHALEGTKPVLLYPFFKNRFTKSEQQTTITNYIMGLSFITEGAIPFAASDPLRIIPPCMLGSAVSGALSMFFECGSRAPHGGIFVVGIMDHAPMFLIALAVGAVIAMEGIVILKKPLPKKKVERMKIKRKRKKRGKENERI